MGQCDAEEWVEAIVEEYNNLEQKSVFIKVECPPDVHVHEGQLLFAEKVGYDGDKMRKKVRLVTKGYMEVWGEDYWHTYSPTLGCNTLFSCLAYAATHDLEIHQMDAVATYLNSDLTEEIYLWPPEGIPASSNTIWCLKKALYGLKQARLEWYQTLWKHLKSISYAQSTYNPCLYIQGEEAFILIYIDDFLVFNSKEKIVETKKELAGRYEIGNLGEVHWFLTMEITRDQVTQTITIDQRQYIAKILKHFELGNWHPVSTLMKTNIKLLKLEFLEVDQQLYQSMLGSLMYTATRTRLDIMFTVHHLSQFSIALGMEHLTAMQCVYQYLNGTQSLGITYYGN